MSQIILQFFQNILGPATCDEICADDMNEDERFQEI
jgi:hypothetical protein